MSNDPGAVAPQQPAYIPPPQGGAMVPPGPSTGGHLVRNILVIVGGCLLLLVLVIGYVIAGGAATGDRVKVSQDALTKVARDHNAASAKLTSAFGTVGGADSATSDKFDAAAARTSLTSAVAEIETLRQNDNADLDLLSRADAKVQDRSFLTLLGGSRLDREHTRLGANRRAVEAELSEIDIMKQQLGIVGDFMTTLVQMQALTADLSATNIAAGERDYAAPSATLDKLITSANAAPETPGRFKEFLVIFRSELTHIKGILDGAQARNVGAITAASNALKTDVANLEKFDTKAMEQEYTDLGKRLDDKVNAELKSAG